MRTLFNFIPRLARALSNKNPLRFLWLLLRLYYFVLSRKLFHNVSHKVYALNGKYNDRSLTFWLEIPMDIVVLVEIFVFKEYEWGLDADPKVIVDLGAHFGDTALYYNAVYPEAKIIAVEPAPENFVRLQKHVESIENIIAINAAVGANDGEMNLHIGSSSLGHSLVKRSETDQVVSVPQYTLQTLYKMHGLQKADLLKFDIEGAEFPLFESIDVNGAADAYIGEMHYDLNSDYSESDTEKLFSNFEEVSLKKIGGKNRYILLAK